MNNFIEYTKEEAAKAFKRVHDFAKLEYEIKVYLRVIIAIELLHLLIEIF